MADFEQHTRTRLAVHPPRLQRSPSLPNLRRSVDHQTPQQSLDTLVLPCVQKLSISDQPVIPISIPSSPTTSHHHIPFPSSLPETPRLPLPLRLRIEQAQLGDFQTAEDQDVQRERFEQQQRQRSTFDVAECFRGTPRTRKTSLLTPPMTPSSSIGNRTTSTNTASSARTVDSMDLTTDGWDDSDCHSRVATPGSESRYQTWADDDNNVFMGDKPVPSRFIWVHNVPRDADNETLRLAFFNVFKTFVPPLSQSNTQELACHSVLKGIYVRHLQDHGVILLAFFDIRQAEMALAAIDDLKGSVAFPASTLEGTLHEWEITEVRAEFVAKSALPLEISEAPFVKSTDASFFVTASLLAPDGAIDLTRVIIPDRLRLSLGAFGSIHHFEETTNDHDRGEHQQVFQVEFSDEREAIMAYNTMRGRTPSDVRMRVYGMYHDESPRSGLSLPPPPPFPTSFHDYGRRGSLDKFKRDEFPPASTYRISDSRRVSFDQGHMVPPYPQTPPRRVDLSININFGGGPPGVVPFQSEESEERVLYECGPTPLTPHHFPPSPYFQSPSHFPPPSPHPMFQFPPSPPQFSPISPLMAKDHEYRMDMARMRGFMSPQHGGRFFPRGPPPPLPDADPFFSQHVCPVYNDEGMLELHSPQQFAPQPCTPLLLENIEMSPQSHLPSPCPSPTRIGAFLRTPNDPGMHDRNQLDLEKIEAGQDTRTTIMLKNIPNKMSAADLLGFIAAIIPRKIDFCYLRIDFQNECNVGYAFINFIEVDDLLTFAKAKLGVKWNLFSSEKVLQMSYATYQGKEALVEKFRNSNIMDERPEWRPQLFVSTPGEEQGLPERFPEPTHLHRKERGAANRGTLFLPPAAASARDVPNPFAAHHFPQLPSRPMLATPTPTPRKGSKTHGIAKQRR